MNEPNITQTLTVEGWSLELWKDDEPRILDLDLAARLEYARPRKIRELIERMIEKRQLTDVRPTVGRSSMPKGGEREDNAYHLTEAQALKVAAKAETEPADKLLDEIIRVFILARRGLLPTQPLFESGLFLGVDSLLKRAAEGQPRKLHE